MIKKIRYRAKEGQDKWVLDKLNQKENGYFVDIGAASGVNNSNSYILEKYFNWKGICVEPNPMKRAFQNLQANRNCICENLCIYNRSGIVDFVAKGKRIEGSGIYGDCSNIAIKDLVKNFGYKIIKVPSLTLLELLDKHKAPRTIDYISIDTEGSEWEILKKFNFSRYTFLTMTIEHNYWEGGGWIKKEKVKRDKIRKLLLESGYTIDRKLPFEDWLVYEYRC